MSRRHEVDDLLRDARAAGVEVRPLRNGHLRVVAPDGRWAVISRHPATDGAVARARSKIRRLSRPDDGKNGAMR